MQLYVTDRALRGKILKWGNSYGIRLRKEDLERLHLREGADVDLVVKPRKIDLSHIRTIRDPEGPTDMADRHDEYFGEYLVAEQERRSRGFADWLKTPEGREWEGKQRAKDR